jgi:hypothetical protein
MYDLQRELPVSLFLAISPCPMTRKDAVGDL